MKFFDLAPGAKALGLGLSMLLLALPMAASAKKDFSPVAGMITCQVVKVSDGDTVKCRPDGAKELKVRLDSIDAPEKAQEGGMESTKELASLVLGKTVVIKTNGRDKYGRVLGFIHSGGININEEMVRRGQAWAFREHLQDSSLMEIEREARKARRGLWAAPKPMYPSHFRHPELRGQPVPGFDADMRAAHVEHETSFMGRLENGGNKVKGFFTGIYDKVMGPGDKKDGDARDDGKAGNPGKNPLVSFSEKNDVTNQPGYGKKYDGTKTGCHQFDSCEEAIWYLRNKHLPIDGDGDGIPCERSLCGHDGKGVR